jgi:magnesium chelatase subunit I
LFVINELPDLQARIQVSLFNILQEGDLQIRGFKLRLPLEVEFIFTANPEDYTNRGSIVTPLKDRIQSQILTHYPKSTAISKSITQSEAKIHPEQHKKITIPELHKDLLEQLVVEARSSEFTDEKSGVSARMSIAAMENLLSTAERRMLINGETSTSTRITDFWGVIPAITGKLEMVYEGEQEGIYNVVMKLLDRAIKNIFDQYFPHPEKSISRDPYGTIKVWFQSANTINLLLDDSDKNYHKQLDEVAGLEKFLDNFNIVEKDLYPFKELVIHGLTSYQIIGRNYLENRFSFEDPLGMLLNDDDDDS